MTFVMSLLLLHSIMFRNGTIWHAHAESHISTVYERKLAVNLSFKLWQIISTDDDTKPETSFSKKNYQQSIFL
jgi:hypothetical protein